MGGETLVEVAVVSLTRVSLSQPRRIVLRVPDPDDVLAHDGHSSFLSFWDGEGFALAAALTPALSQRERELN